MPALSKPLAEAMEAQANREFSAAYLYLSMSTHCDAVGYRGAGKWLRSQSSEELTHALKIIDFMGKRGNRTRLKDIGEPRSSFGSLLEIFEEALQSEEAVTSAINEIYEVARLEKDRSTQNFLEWYIAEQVEEESSAQEVIDRLKIAGSNEAAILLLDAELGNRGDAGQGANSAQAE